VANLLRWHALFRLAVARSALELLLRPRPHHVFHQVEGFRIAPGYDAESLRTELIEPPLNPALPLIVIEIILALRIAMSFGARP
jgi:hypothetical protein